MKIDEHTIPLSDKFIPSKYPLVVSELNVMSTHFRTIHSERKSAMVISFLRDHSLRTTWLSEEPELTQLITSRKFDMSQTEALFSLCRSHPGFCGSFEEYIDTLFLQDPKAPAG
jgi:hypothetical protein